MRRTSIPPAPLLRTYLDAGPPAVEELFRLPGLGARWAAIASVRSDLLADDFLANADAATWADRLTAFYADTVRPALFIETIRRRAGLVRHAVQHLIHCADPLTLKFDRCASSDGPYFVAGLGPAFWSALLQALGPDDRPGWVSSTVAGLKRLGLADWPAHARPGTVYGRMMRTYAHWRATTPALTAFHLDHFLSLVAAMPGRDLAPCLAAAGPTAEPIDRLKDLVREQRSRTPLRRRLKERGPIVEVARARLMEGLERGDAAAVWAALTAADTELANRHLPSSAAAALLDRVGRLWNADHPFEVLDAFWHADPLPGLGLGLPATVMHLRDAGRFPLWNDRARAGFARLDDSPGPGVPPAESYRLFCEGTAWLCRQHRIHPIELPDLLAALAETDRGAGDGREPLAFAGFCADTFRFLTDLAANNRRDWMHHQRERYRFAVREPLRELCRALAERYVGPVLHQQYGWDLETEDRAGRALSSVVKNDYGRSVPYQTALWVTFYRRACGGKRDDVQFYVRVDADGVEYGLRLGRSARAAGKLFRRNVQAHAEELFQALAAGGATAECRFGRGESLIGAGPLKGVADLRAWAAGKELVAGKRLAPGDPMLANEELVGDVLLTFDRLLPAYVCAVEEGPVPLLARRAGRSGPGGGFGPAQFCAATHLSEGWLARARGLLDLKKQLILQGVPGTGKTHVARCLARVLAHDCSEAVRLVQFHPAFGYEEFVEGIKARTVEMNGRHEVTYPVEDGLLTAFAAEAAKRPAEPFVLLIDEINRGNLPRIFGELLYLLEYRGQAVKLPYSQRSFRLPENLYLVGTMNAADRSVALVDQALRRRFSFLEMPPDAAVLASWLEAHSAANGNEFGARVVRLFEALNAKLCAELGPQAQVGHSFFMVPGLDEGRLRVVWRHHVWPLLEEHCASRPERLAGFDLDRLMNGRKSPVGRP